MAQAGTNAYKTVGNRPVKEVFLGPDRLSRRKQIYEMWEMRLIGTTYAPRCGKSEKLDGVRPNIEDWQKIILVRGLVPKRRLDEGEETICLRQRINF